jgi:6-phosphogluconolactonase (cycloisomerase 2 family)
MSYRVLMKLKQAALLLPVGLAICLATGAAPASAHTLYVTDFFGVNFLRIEADDSLTELTGSPWGGGSQNEAVVLTPDGERLYVASLGTSEILGFDVNPDGSLTPLEESPFATGSEPLGLAVAPDSDYLYVSDPGLDEVQSFAIGPAGGLTLADSFEGGVGTARLTGLALSADGSRLYAGDRRDGGTVIALAVAPDGSLSEIAGSPFPAGANPLQLTITPDGRFLYVAAATANRIFGYAIDADGGLSAVPGPVFETGALARGPSASPAGGLLFYANRNDSSVGTASIGPDGALAAVGGPVAVGPSPVDTSLTPDGSALFVVNAPVGGNSVSSFSVDPGGSLNVVPGSPFPLTGDQGFVDDGSAVSPNQPPQAVLSSSASSVEAGHEVAFDASASTDPDGTIARYDWDFGDGSTLPDGGPAPSHVYDNPGDFEVSVTLTDDEGCSTTFITTGQTASCNGSGVARGTRAVEVTRTPPVISRLAVTPRKFRASGRPTSLERRRGAHIKITLSEDASVRFRVRRDPPDRTGGPPPRSPRVFDRQLAAGSNSVAFTGKLGKKKLKPRRYTLTARATDADGLRSAKTVTRFKVKKER